MTDPMLSTSTGDATPYNTGEEWQDGAKARAFKANEYYDRLLAKAETDPDALAKLDATTRMNVAMYEQFKAGATRHNKRETR